MNPIFFQVRLVGAQSNLDPGNVEATLMFKLFVKFLRHLLWKTTTSLCCHDGFRVCSYLGGFASSWLFGADGLCQVAAT